MLPLLSSTACRHPNVVGYGQNSAVRPPSSISELVRAIDSLKVADHFDLTPEELALLEQHRGPEAWSESDALIQLVAEGADPLGDAYTTIKTPADRRPLGQTYTPNAIVQSMTSWATTHEQPVRIVDPGAGSGRYLLAAARVFPDAQLIGLDVDPLATLMLRANVLAAGMQDRATVVLGDYRALDISPEDGPTLFIGNPPYVRHHEISEEWKHWLTATAAEFGIKASKLAGLHIHFFLATAKHGRAGDYGAFITSAEWLDVNYGSVLRQLLLGKLGGTEIHVLEPEVEAFADAQTTAAITCFTVGEQPASLQLRRVAAVDDLGSLGTGTAVSRARLLESNRWSVLTRTPALTHDGFIELGELCRVHRGTVTGANKAWVTTGDSKLPASVFYPTITKARELFNAGEELHDPTTLRQVIDLPVDLDVFDPAERRAINRFLKELKSSGVHEGYVASSRRAWWSVGLKKAAPILATYMARRPPAFVMNTAEARHINIAHGLYPRQELSASVLSALAQHLRHAVNLSQGRTYAGGLTKFEPKEMERLPIPDLDTLTERATA